MSQFKDQEKEAIAQPSLKVSNQSAVPEGEPQEPSTELSSITESNGKSKIDEEIQNYDPDKPFFTPEQMERFRQMAQHGSSAGRSYSSAYEDAMEASNRSWQGINQIFDLTTQVGIFAVLAICMVVGGMAISTLFHPASPTQPGFDWSQIGEVLAAIVAGFAGNREIHAPNMDQVLNLLPWAALGCALTTAFATYIARSSKSREIDWTDSHLMLEYSGPINLVFKWTAIKSIDQIWKWDIFHGKQPVFLLTTQEDNVLKLKLSDITAKNDVGSFFSLIKEHAPKAKFNVDPKFATDESYTELWLKYFSKATDRTRSGLLEKDMVVCDGMYRIVGTIGGGGQGTAYLAIVENETIPDSAFRQDAEGKIEVTMGNKEARHILNRARGEQKTHRQLLSGQEVVLKEYVLPVHRGQLTAERTAEKLKAEADILDKLDHPQIVRLKDAFIEDYRGYLVLDFVAGESLKSLTDRLGPQTEDQIVDWAIQVLNILHYMHGLTPSLVHRDITPDNLMLQEDGMIKLVDFNVAYQVDSSATATVVGKHAYIPAEQFRGKPVPQSDIYSLGGTMFYLLTGKEPEPISTAHPANHSQFVSPELDAIVARATSTPLSERYANVEEFKQDLLKLKNK